MSAGSMPVLSVDLMRPPTAMAAPRPGSGVHAADRLALLDAMRLIAAIGIVWVHAAQSDAGKLFAPLGTFGVPFYTFAAVLFMARSLTQPGGRSLGGYVVSRGLRIYLPFLFWSAVYVSLGEMKSVVEEHTFHLPSAVVLYAGGHEHLWFLPYLMVVTITGAVLVTLVRRAPGLRWPLVTTLVALGGIAAMLREPAWVATRDADSDFWRYAIRATPTVFWSLALGLAAVRDGRLPRTTPRLALAGLFLLIVALLLQETWLPFKVLRSLAGVGCLMIALLPLATPGLVRLGRLGRHSYGIYLSHLVFLRIAALWIEHRRLTPTLGTDTAAFAFAFVGATLLSTLLAQSRWTRWTLGE